VVALEKEVDSVTLSLFYLVRGKEQRRRKERGKEREGKIGR
jgi:hypothetical protein